VIGCGDVSSVHFGAIERLRDVRLVGVCDPDRPRREAAAETHAVPGFGTHGELLAAVRPDVVHICTPHSEHVSIALDALAAGAAVILEKPLAHTREEGARLVEASAGRIPKIGVCFQNRYNEPVRFVRERLLSGDLGKILGASASVVWHRSAEYYADRPWRGRWSTSGGGLLMNQAIHTLDLLQWIVGDVTAVRGGAATRYLEGVIEVEDTADMVLEHRGGARSVFYATLANVVNEPVTLDIVTERAAISLRADATITHADGRVETAREARTATGERSYWGVSHEALISDFYDRLDDDEPFWISPAEAAKTLSIIQDVYDQSVPGRTSGSVAHPAAH
jgi:predicted dehydrogenase